MTSARSNRGRRSSSTAPLGALASTPSRSRKRWEPRSPAGKADLVRSLGADHVIDYTEEDFTKGDREYDFILDNVGNRSLSDSRRALSPNGTLIPNSGTAGGTWIGPLVSMGQAWVTSPFVSQNLRTFLSTPNEEDLNALVDLVASGDVVPVIGGTYSLDEAAEALRTVADGHATGKIVVTVAQD